MSEEDHTWPQDKGQGVDDPDYDDAASFAQAVFDPALKDVVVKGLEFENLGSESFDLTGGVAKVYVPSMQTKDRGSGGEFRDECLVTQQVVARNGVTYDGSGTTHVFLQIDLSKNNSASIITNGDGTAPAEPSMKLGVIDEATDTAEAVNRKLAGDFEEVSSEQVYLGHLASTPTADDVPADMTVLYVKEDGSLYKMDDGGTESKVGGEAVDGEHIEPDSVRTETSLTERFPTLDVDAFGAVGDGATDDRDAILAAVDSLGDGEQAILNFSAGKEYYVSQPLNISPADCPIIDMSGAALVVDGSYAALHYQGSHTTTSSHPRAGDVQSIASTELAPRIIDFEARSTEPLSGTYVGKGLVVEATFGLTLERPYCHSLNHGVEFQGTNRNVSIDSPHLWDNRTSCLRFNGTDLHQIDIDGGFIQGAETPVLFDSTAQIYNLQISGVDIEVFSNNQQIPSTACMKLAEGCRMQEASIDGCTIQAHTSPIPIIDLQGTVRYVNITDDHMSNADYAIRATATSDVRELAISGITSKQLDYIFHTETTSHLLGLSMSDITAERTALAYIDCGEKLGPVSISNIDIRPTNMDGDWLYIHADILHGLHIEDVNAYPEGTYNSTGWMMNVEHTTEAHRVQIKNNKLYTRAGGGSRDGLRVDSTNITSGHIKDNLLQDVPNDQTAFDLPADSSTVHVSGNVSI